MSAFDAIDTHGRSFAKAARLLGRRDGMRIARLYALCRALDDLADEDGSAAAFDRLAAIRREVADGRAADPLAEAALGLLPPGHGRAAFGDLVTGLMSDRGEVAIPDEAALDLYAYRVAGTVGLMVCAALDVPLDARARARAVALGKAMQMTNIARDVSEDARRGRRYLPATWLDLPPAAIAQPGPHDRRRIAAATARLLDLAETHYADGRQGLPFLPLRLRLAVRAASGAYRDIGRVVRAHDCDPLAPRAQVPPMAKLWAALIWTAPPSRQEASHGRA